MSTIEPHSAARSAALSSNQRCYDSLVTAQSALCRPASDAELADPLGTLDPIGWLEGSVRGKRLLCLAAGGGRQSALYATAGAEVTVVDISPAMLELDRQVARRRKLSIRIVQASMDQLTPLANASFEIVVHPVSTCYLPDIGPVFREVSRVLVPGGIYVSQHKSPINLQASHGRNLRSHYEILHPCYRDGPIPAAAESSSATKRLRELGAIEYLHRLEQILGGICRNGMVIEDFIEPFHADPEAPANSFGDRARFVPPYLRIKARKRAPLGSHAAGESVRRLVTPHDPAPPDVPEVGPGGNVSAPTRILLPD
ncbi:MAG: class I SAM-dependent methyltransferase [Planctomycetaceae bacterium]|nr:MAG: class I SAM-dependent methyltransferase [Planctomycetaceae bacterium]